MELASNEMADRGNRLTELIGKYEKQLRSFIRSRIGSLEDAEDILQDVWYRLSKSIDVDDIEQVGAWLYRVSRNLLSDRYRQRERRGIRVSAQTEEGGHELNAVSKSRQNPEDLYRASMFWERLDEALDDLPFEQRQVFELNVLEGKSLVDIADEKGLNVKTVISRKSYALKKLREILGDVYEDFFN